MEALLVDLKPRLRELDVGSDSVAEIKGNWNSALTNLYKFLGLAALMALLLGSVGVASAIHVYVSQRLQTAAVLRCVGARVRSTFGIYAIQAVLLGLVGSVAGAVLGVLVQQLLPIVLADFIPVDVSFSVSSSAVLFGVAVGTTVTVLFALLPLLKVRRVSPMMALRTAAGLNEGKGIDWLKVGLLALLAVAVLAIAIGQGPNTIVAIAYVLALVLVCALLAGLAAVATRSLKVLSTERLTYVWRQGIANLYRPNNQTLMMLLAIGLGTFLVATFLSLQHLLLNQIETADDRGRPNLVFFDIQPDQTDGVQRILADRGLEAVETVPIVTMRLSAINGRTIDELRADSTVRTTWAHRREYRSTFRDYLTESEEVVEGTFDPGPYSPDDVVPVSVEQDLLTELDATIGDTLVFDVQGIPVTTTVGSVRRVEWRQVRTNFFVVFPDGVLNDAPHFNVIVTRADDETESGAIQAAVIREYPSVSAIDLSLILQVVEAVFDKVAFAVRFMAAFSIMTGFIVLAAAVVVSRV
ncbi:MAG: FtsX-like permease family protein, partial [Rhodothermales bacterium]|nr:FtsX-like permease family protein [Rhodothermales bacterium]